MKNLAIIPARGGSKRIPRKNIKNFLGKPIIAYSIEAALKSDCFDEVMVSTEDEEIAEIARQYGAKVPFLRSEKTANDFADTEDVIFEVLENYHNLGKDFDNICCLYATAPFVTSERLVEAFKLMNENVDASISVVEYSFPIQRSIRVGETGHIELNFPEYINYRSQDLPKTYHDAGQFYFAKVKTFKEEKTLWCKRTAPLVLSELEVQDLDTMTDWQLAEMKFKLIHD
jgi:N-acylneuraminate cytidylyltransferase